MRKQARNITGEVCVCVFFPGWRDGRHRQNGSFWFSVSESFGSHRCYSIKFADILDYVVVSKIFYFHPYLGKIPMLTNIFQRG